MFFVCTNHIDPAFASDHLAFLANFFCRRTYFHKKFKLHKNINHCRDIDARLHCQATPQWLIFLFLIIFFKTDK